MPLDPGDSCDPAELARLARLDLDQEERSLFAGQLQQMIESFNRISALPTEDVEPFAHPGDPLLTVRPDDPSPGTGGEGFLSVPPLFVERRGGEQ